MTYRLSPAAWADMRSIWIYTNETWGIAQADKYILGLEAMCESLASGAMPGRSASHFRQGYRMASAGSHFIFYRTSPEGHLDIIRILHQRMDLRSRLSEKR